MKVSIRCLEKKLSQILPLAEAYQRSYNKLSQGYKSPEEMALYTRGYFLKKLWKMAEDKDSVVAVLNIDDKPCGFVRYSAIPEYYTNPVNGQSRDLEKGMLDGFEFAWYRKVNFERDVPLNNKTLIVNQIYLDPQIQRCGLGTYLLSKTIPELKKQGYESLIIEYNAHNDNAEKFYRGIGFRAFAKTQDFDHIIKKNGKTTFCISDVAIAHTTIDNAINCMREKQLSKTYITMVQQKNGKSY